VKAMVLDGSSWLRSFEAGLPSHVTFTVHMNDNDVRNSCRSSNESVRIIRLHTYYTYV